MSKFDGSSADQSSCDDYTLGIGDPSMDQYVEKVIRMDEKIDRLILDVREMKNDVTQRVSYLEREKADLHDLEELKSLIKEAIKKMVSSEALTALNGDFQKHSEDSSKLIKSADERISALGLEVTALNQFKWRVAGILAGANAVVWVIITLWAGLGQSIPTVVGK